jgi:uncharacterized protein YyaL (SSP411 family)
MTDVTEKNMTANRLINEKSPYLLQHAHNPVNWYPWSEEAFDRAKAEDKPVFVSIGYATCHWCHVMEKESFEDEETAGHLNETFICIKVDREERPDIDSVYMVACQMLTGSGGWPLNVFMTPGKKPFFAATYIPNRSRFGRPGLVELCQKIKELWRLQKEKVLETAADVVDNLGRAFEFSPERELDPSLLDQAYDQIRESFDAKLGGFKPAPKFPTPHRLLFLLRRYHRSGNPLALEMVRKTLEAMRLGGLWDHVGFGFHRYSTDKEWRVPHFEKMLYDQALIAFACTEAYQITKEKFFANTADEIFAYVFRDMTSAEGVFYSAEDADSEGEEGKFYVWTTEAFREALGEEGAERWMGIFNLREEGNFSEEAAGRKTGTNILYLDRPLSRWAETLNMQESELVLEWEKIRDKLFQARKKRVRPLKDDKVLTDWNGLMIAALASGARVLDKPEYARAAERAVEFLMREMRDRSGRLRHRFRDGEVAIDAQANDYAFFILGLLELYRSTFDPAHVKRAIMLQEQMLNDFWDEDKGGFFSTGKWMTELPARPKEVYDGAIPSANSVSLFNLLSLSRLTGDARWEHKAYDLARALMGTVRTHPSAYTQFLIGLDFALSPNQEVVIAGDPDSPEAKEMISILNARFLPGLVVIFKSRSWEKDLVQFAGFTAALQPVEGKATAYVCTNFSCHRPTSDARTLAALIQDRKGTE